MKRKLKNSPRQMWSKKEDENLLSILSGDKKRPWKMVAAELQTLDPGSKKSAKQCRERFRNYLDPTIKEKQWTKNEKVIFLLLHNHHGNHWGQIAKYYNGKSDICIKNLFYAYFRKILRKLKGKAVPFNITSKPRKILRLYYALNLIQLKYLPILEKLKGKTPDKKHEKIILELIKNRNLNRDEIKTVLSALIASLKESTSKDSFPIIIEITLNELNLNEDRSKSFKTILENQLFGELSKFVVIAASDSTDNLPFPTPKLPLAPPLVSIAPGTSIISYPNNSSLVPNVIPSFPNIYQTFQFPTPGLCTYVPMENYWAGHNPAYPINLNPAFMLRQISQYGTLGQIKSADKAIFPSVYN